MSDDLTMHPLYRGYGPIREQTCRVAGCGKRVGTRGALCSKCQARKKREIREEEGDE